MKSSLDRSQLARYVARQLAAVFPDNAALPLKPWRAAMASALDRMARLTEVVRPGKDGMKNPPFFSHLHSDQYASFLYLLSNELYRREATGPATKVYLLNKALHSLDIFYEVELPDIFLLSHPVGTVLGRAKYGDFLVVMQNCTVGDVNGRYPTLGKRVVLCTGSIVVGGSVLGDEVCVGAGSMLVHASIPPRRTVVGRGKDLRILPSPEPPWKHHFFDD